MFAIKKAIGFRSPALPVALYVDVICDGEKVSIPLLIISFDERVFSN